MSFSWYAEHSVSPDGDSPPPDFALVSHRVCVCGCKKGAKFEGGRSAIGIPSVALTTRVHRFVLGGGVFVVDVDGDSGGTESATGNANFSRRTCGR